MEGALHTPHNYNPGAAIMRRRTENPGLVCLGVLSAAAVFFHAGILNAVEPAARLTQNQNQNQNALAREILDATGVKGGLVVHLGCGNGTLTAALRADDSYLVHGLDVDRGNVAQARQHLQSLSINGKVSVEQFDGRRLPFIDNLVNLLVSGQPIEIARDEVLRVLAPDGVAYVKQGDAWTKTVKPRPEEIDQWTHFLHDATGNAVANDAGVGPPRHMQWMAAPTWCRNHHTLASISSVVSAGGRIFYIVDEGSAASMKASGKWSVVARDAFSGMLLWERRVRPWAWHRHGFRSGPVQLPRTLVAGTDCVYVPLGMGAAVSALDAATGEIVKTYPDTKNTEEIILHDSVLLAVVGAPASEQAGIDPTWSPMVKFPNRKSIVAIRAGSGEMLWKRSNSPADNPVPLTLAAEDGRVFFGTGKSVLCLDKNTGEELWRRSPPPAEQTDRPNKPGKKQMPGKKQNPTKKRARPLRSLGWSVATLVVHDGVVLWADGKRLSALSVQNGKTLWECECKPGFRSPVDVLVIAGLVWLGPDFAAGRDLRSGEIEKTSSAVHDIWTIGHHHRCYREKATDRYIITGKRGIEFLDLDSDNHSRNNWVRGVCQYGVMPSNGLIYAPSHACGCFMEAKLYGFWALSAKREEKGERREKREEEGGRREKGERRREGKKREKGEASADRLQRGPAYDSVPTSDLHPPTSDDWPTHRHDPLRSGSTATQLRAPLRPVWQAAIEGRSSAPVVVDGTVLVSCIDAPRVVALDARNGKVRWTFTAGGRVDSPPTAYRGLVLFGCRDGRVYALRLADGQLAWRFRAAPEELKTVALDQVESVWPVHGSVLVQDGVAYTAAGRSSYLDGGIHVFGLDPTTGKIVCQTLVQSGSPKPHASSAERESGIEPKNIVQNATDFKTFVDPDRSDAFSMGGATTDIFVGDGTAVYMRQVKFDRDCVRQKQQSRHLFSTTGLLDDAEVHRSHWVLGTGDFRRIPVAYSWIANSPRGGWGSRLAVPYGLLLSFDQQTVWGVRRTRDYGYILFAERNRPFSPGEQSLPDFRPSDGKTASPWQWSVKLPIRPRAMLRAGDQLLIGGMISPTEPADLAAAYEGRKGGLLWTMSAKNGEKLAELQLDAPPVFDGLAAAAGRLYLTTTDGKVRCFAGR